ncbi:hypothetical protein E4U21_004406 [Claviceps maximensis]|nr:hypothetical protein E4U21_004406 [Claviceps maximensis]
MKWTAAILALAATVIAVPTGGSGNPCSTNGHNNYVCCGIDDHSTVNQGSLLGILPIGNILKQLSCTVNVLGKTCGDDSYCCSDSSVQNGLVNLGLNCLKL